MDSDVGVDQDLDREVTDQGEQERIARIESNASAVSDQDEIVDTVNDGIGIVAEDIDADIITQNTDLQSCRVTLTSPQKPNTTVQDKIKFDNKIHDSDANFSISTHNWTCPEDGIYIARLQVDCSLTDSGKLQTEISISDPPDSTQNEGVFNRSFRSFDSENTVRKSIATINEYSKKDIIAFYADNKSGGEFRASTGEVVFLGTL
jgi:hypothetical protein